MSCIPAPSTDRRRGPRLPSAARLSQGATSPRAADPRETGLEFPAGSAWAVTEANVRSWAIHEFGHWFEDNPALAHALGALDDHPIYLLRLDIQQYRRLFRQWARCAELDQSSAPANGSQRECFRLSVENYAAGLTVYLRKGRESWGRADA